MVRSSQSSLLFAKPVKFALRPSAILNVLTTVANVSTTRHFGVVARSDVGANLRLAVFERSIVILYVVEDDVVTNIFSGGGDYEALLRGN